MHSVQLNALKFQNPVRRALYLYFQRKYGSQRGAMKLLGQAARRSPFTARQWLYGQCMPEAEALIELMGSCEELTKIVNDLAEESRRARLQK